MQARPCPTFGRPVRLRGSPHRLRPGTSPHALRIPPHDGHPALRSAAQEDGSRSALAVSSFRFRARVGLFIPSFFLRPARHYPRFWIWLPSSGRQRDFNPPEQRAAQRTLWPLLTSVRSRRKFLPAALCRIPVCRLFARLRLATRRNAWALMIQLRPFWKYGSARHRYARQISPGKNAMFPCASAAFTLPAVSDGLRHEVPTRPQTRPSMQFLSVASHFCTPASSRQVLADLPLPSASGYHRFIMNPCRYSHRGLAPHHIAPMLGAHPSVHRTLRDKAAQRR